MDTSHKKPEAAEAVSLHPIIRYFACAHLPVGPLRRTSAYFAELAVALDELLPAGPEKTVALRKLLESKDAAVRAALDLP